jgi:hypothetical protein
LSRVRTPICAHNGPESRRTGGDDDQLDFEESHFEDALTA